MKVLLFSEGKKLFSKSGVGKAAIHQMKALENAGVEYTRDPKDDYDIAHINTLGFTSKQILKRTKKAGKPVIYHTHTTYEDFQKSFIGSDFMAPFIKKRIIELYGNADFLIFPSHYTQNLVRSYGVATHGKMVSNGVDLDEFQQCETLKSLFLQQYEISTPFIMCVGLPFERKGIVDFYTIARSRPGYTFMWFGANIKGILPHSIRKILKNPPKNLLFPGFVPQETLLGAYNAADIFFFPSYEENEGIVVLEALAMKTPLLVRDIPVYADWLSHGLNCYKGNNTAEFLHIIDSIVSSRQQANGMTEAAYKKAEERSLTIVGKELKHIYTHVLDGV
jgi:1,2-diacylglycerol-3-alpha-glucose alpha-1,2-glucosyltransferase